MITPSVIQPLFSWPWTSYRALATFHSLFWAPAAKIGAEPGLGARPDDLDAAVDEAQLAGAHEVAHDGRQGVDRPLAAERALRVLEDHEGGRCARPPERVALLRDPGVHVGRSRGGRRLRLDARAVVVGAASLEEEPPDATRISTTASTAAPAHGGRDQEQAVSLHAPRMPDGVSVCSVFVRTV